MGEKTYLGDGVYADHDGYAVVLTTENGIRVTNRIVLEPEVFSALVRYVERATGSTTCPPIEQEIIHIEPEPDLALLLASIATDDDLGPMLESIAEDDRQLFASLTETESDPESEEG